MHIKEVNKISWYFLSYCRLFTMITWLCNLWFMKPHRTYLNFLLSHFMHASTLILYRMTIYEYILCILVLLTSSLFRLQKKKKKQKKKKTLNCSFFIRCQSVLNMSCLILYHDLFSWILRYIIFCHRIRTSKLHALQTPRSVARRDPIWKHVTWHRFWNAHAFENQPPHWYSWPSQKYRIMYSIF